MNKANIKITIDRHNLHPDNFNLNDTGNFLCIFFELLSKIKSSSNIQVGLTAIEDNCVSYQFYGNPVALQAFVMLYKFQKSNYRNLPTNCNPSIDKLNKFMTRTGTNIGFFGTKKEKLRLSPSNPLRKIEVYEFQSPTTVYGELLNIGGKTPNAHIMLQSTGKTIMCNLNKEQAIQLANKLYQIIGLHGFAYYQADEIIKFKVISISQFNQNKKYNPFAKMREMGANKYFDELDVNSYVKYMRS